MELRTKYQYSYFIYPFLINEGKFDKFILRLLKNKNCKMKYFAREKDINIYTHFLPKIRQYMFWSFDYSDVKKEKLDRLSLDTKAAIIAKQPCTMFEYNMGNKVQGKVVDSDGIFFDVPNIDIICFKTGICFILIKTVISNNNKFSEVLDFNYKFRDVNSNYGKLKDIENIKIQTSTFKDIKELSEIIKEISGTGISAKEININSDSFITYSYACVDQQDWNKDTDEEIIDSNMYRFVNVLKSTDKIDFNDEAQKRKMKTLEYWKYIKYGTTKQSAVLLASCENSDNYTKLPHAFEREYLYLYILTLYKKIYLNKLIYDMKKTSNFERVRRKFIKFTQDIWIQEATNDETGAMLYDDWQEALGIQREYKEIKNRYDVEYKDYNIEKTKKSNKLITVLLVTTIILNIIGFIILYIKGGI